jgi:hypothetical protein
MANRAYISIWTRGYSEAVMLEQFEVLLATIPLSAQRPAFTSLVVRAVSPSEAPLVEQDARAHPASASDIAAWAREYRNADTSYEAEGWWDLWLWSAEPGRWQRKPERLLVICNGPEYDDGAAQETGYYTVDIGFEHRFTGHGGLLGSGVAPSAPADPVEAEFLALMKSEQRLQEYYEKTQENIQQLLNWIRGIEGALPVERYRLWSEGEANLEARLDEILAVH